MSYGRANAPGVIGVEQLTRLGSLTVHPSRTSIEPTHACAAAQRFHHPELLDSGVHILGHPAMLHAKAFVRDGEEVLAGTCNLEAWSLKRFFEIDVRVRSHDFEAAAYAAISPVL